MEEEYSIENPAQLIEAANDFANYPGVQNDAAAKAFLDRFPLPVIINALQTKTDLPGVENALVGCLEVLFKTKYGSSLIPHYMPFVQVGLRADSQAVRCLVCKTITCLFENFDDKTVSPAQLVIDNDVYPLLLDCLIHGDEQVATASMDAIKKLAASSEGMGIVFPANSNDAMHLGNISARCSSLGRVRVLALIVKLFSISSTVASAIYNSNLLSLLEAEVSKTNDMLVTLSVLELLYELAEIQHGTEFLSRTTLLQLLSSIISNSSMETVLRSRAMTISGRLLSKENMYMFIDQSTWRLQIATIMCDPWSAADMLQPLHDIVHEAANSHEKADDHFLSTLCLPIGVSTLIASIVGRLGSLESDTDECESALEALGQIGSSIQGAALLLSSSPPAARHVIDAAFDRQGRGKQLAALHALANISGETRTENHVILNGDAEASLRHLIYETASRSSKLTPSGLFLSVLQQDPEIRLAGYRMMTGLVARLWCLMEICSKQEIINIVTGATTETTKIGMEAKYNCCKAIHKAFSSSSKLISDPAFAGLAAKLQEAVRRGPYLVTTNLEAQPAVKTAERF